MRSVTFWRHIESETWVHSYATQQTFSYVIGERAFIVETTWPFQTIEF